MPQRKWWNRIPRVELVGENEQPLNREDRFGVWAIYLGLLVLFLWPWWGRLIFHNMDKPKGSIWWLIGGVVGTALVFFIMPPYINLWLSKRKAKRNPPPEDF